MAGVRHARGALVFAEPTPERVQFRLDDKAASPLRHRTG
jgi:hypothetical protein